MIVLRRLVWDDWNLQHIARHGVTREDVEAVCQSDLILFRERYKDRLVFLGRGRDDRLMAVVLGPVPNAPAGTYYPFTARPAHRSERRVYERLKGDSLS